MTHHEDDPARESTERHAYLQKSKGDPFRPHGIYWIQFANWFAGDRLKKLPIGLRHVLMLVRNWKVFWRPRRLEFRYMGDGFATKSRLQFLTDPAFVRSYNRMLAARGGPNDPGLHLRIHQALWIASVCKRLPGDFVECGTGRGMVMSAVLESLDEWEHLNKSVWLCDTFSPHYLNEVTGKNDDSKAKSTNYAVSIESTRKNFSQWSRVNLVQGFLPESLDGVAIDKIAFLHLDLNFASAEQSVLRKLWPKITPGGMVLLDDFGTNELQNVAMVEVAEEFGVQILTTGSSQGIIIKG
jgi:O-methyltransferase